MENWIALDIRKGLNKMESNFDKKIIKIALPKEIIDKIDVINEIMDFPDREAFLMIAVRRLVDHYYPLIFEYSYTNKKIVNDRSKYDIKQMNI